MREKSPRFAEPLKRKVQWTLRAAKTLARLDRANDFPIRSAEPLKAEALLLRGEVIRTDNSCERTKYSRVALCAFCSAFVNL